MLRVLMLGLLLLVAPVMAAGAHAAGGDGDALNKPVDEAVEEWVLPKAKKNLVRPSYPRQLQQDGRDGWVFLTLSVTEDGKVSDATVLDSYPEGVFDRVALDAAPLWEFTPGLRDGKPAAMRFTFSVAFMMQTRPGIRPEKKRLFQKTYKALEGKDMTTTGEGLEEMRQLFEAKGLNIAEAARYHVFLTSYHYLKAEYAAVQDTSRRAIMLSRFLDNKSAIDFTHLERVASYIALREFDNAVDYFDRWREDSKLPPSQELIVLIERLRAAGAGKKTVFDVFNYAELDGAPEK